MTVKAPRVVVVTRETEYQLLLARHATFGQAKFFLETRGQEITGIRERHERFETALGQVLGAIPVDWRVSRVGRRDLPRFLFAPADTVIAVGQDGLVANTAKYLDGQFVLGINPAPDLYEGVLVPHPPGGPGGPACPRGQAHRDCGRADHGQGGPRRRAEPRGAQRDLPGAPHPPVGTVPHRRRRDERTPVIVGDHRHHGDRRHRPTDPAAAFFVREAWPSVATGTGITEGLIEGKDTLEVTSEMNDNGVLFGDGIEKDFLRLDWGVTATIGVAGKTLNLVEG